MVLHLVFLLHDPGSAFLPNPHLLKHWSLAQELTCMGELPAGGTGKCQRVLLQTPTVSLLKRRKKSIPNKQNSYQSLYQTPPKLAFGS